MGLLLHQLGSRVGQTVAYTWGRKLVKRLLQGTLGIECALCQRQLALLAGVVRCRARVDVRLTQVLTLRSLVMQEFRM